MVVPTLEELPIYVRTSLESVAKNEGFTDFTLEMNQERILAMDLLASCYVCQSRV